MIEEDLIFKQDLNKLKLINDENELNQRFSKVKGFCTTISMAQCILYHIAPKRKKNFKMILLGLQITGKIKRFLKLLTDTPNTEFLKYSVGTRC